MKFQAEDILVVMAMPEEGGALLEKMGANVIYTGLGKVNATYGLTKALMNHRPKLVLNLGTAGSKLFGKGDVVACQRFVQRDMDATPLGFLPFQTPFDRTPTVIDHPSVLHHLPQATCGSGDSFVTNHGQDMGEVVDMEAYALAKVCLLEEVLFACAKFISDGADMHAHHHWQGSFDTAAESFVHIFRSLIYPPL